MEIGSENKRKPSLNMQVIVMTAILLSIFIVNIAACIITQFLFSVTSIEHMLSENLDAAVTSVNNGLRNIYTVIKDHAFDYEFIAGSASQKEEKLKSIATFDEYIIALTYVDSSGTVYGPEVPSNVVSSARSAGSAMTTPENEDGDFYLAVNTDFGCLVSHMKASKLSTIVSGNACEAYILTNSGMVIASYSKYGAYEKSYPQYVNQKEDERIIDASSVTVGDEHYVFSSEYINGTDGWSIMVRAKSNEYYEGVFV